MVNIPQLLKLCQSNYLQCVASFRILVYNLFLEVQEAISECSYCKSNSLAPTSLFVPVVENKRARFEVGKGVRLRYIFIRQGITNVWSLKEYICTKTFLSFPASL